MALIESGYPFLLLSDEAHVKLRRVELFHQCHILTEIFWNAKLYRRVLIIHNGLRSLTF